MNASFGPLTLAGILCFMAGVERVSVGRVPVGRVQEVAAGRRTGRLYCRVGIGFHLQIHGDGTVNGSHEPDRPSVLELFSLSPGVVGIRGVSSRRFLSMSVRGRLHATERFSDDCMFRERFQDNGYNTYSSVSRGGAGGGRRWFVALNKRGKAKMGSCLRVRPQHASTHFLPRVSWTDASQPGFIVTQRRSFTITEGRSFTPRHPAKASSIQAEAPPPRRPVRYWPKYRFG